MTDEYSVKFNIGQVIHHKKFGYRGVIIDVDPVFNSTEEWYEKVALSRPPKDKPWYHVIVEDSNTQRYVAERHLEIDNSKQPINHPVVNEIFSEFEDGIYKSNNAKN